MSNFELIDDYLANRLNEQDRKDFEHQLDGDPALKEEVDFQQQVVSGVRQARAIELKSMLNNIPVTGSFWSGGKIAAAAVTVGLVATSLYFYQKEDEQLITPIESVQQEISTPPSEHATEPDITPAAESKANENTSATSKSAGQPTEKPRVINEERPSTPVRKPAAAPSATGTYPPASSGCPFRPGCDQSGVHAS